MAKRLFLAEKPLRCLTRGQMLDRWETQPKED